MPEEHQQRPWLQLLLPTFLWVGAFFLRPHVFRGGCGTLPDLCRAESLPLMDRGALGFAYVSWDFASNVMQNSAGALLALACLAPWILKRNRLALSESMNLLRQSLVLIAWNGACVEMVRDAVQRPRPLVFTRPLEEGLNPMQFTSFYSGHTSFVALVSLLLAVRFSKNPYRLPAVFGAIGFTCLVGIARVLGGRHFPTDVLCGALAGFAIAGLGLIFQNDTRSRCNDH